MRPRTRWFAALVLLAAALVPLACQVGAAELTLDLGDHTETLTTEQLLARPDAVTIEVPQDATYQRPMTYRAVPLRALLQGMALAPGEDLEVVARDGFVTALPTALVFPLAGGGAVPWLAVEPLDVPWPPPAEGVATGPFYLVWLKPEASGVRREQWPFAVGVIRPAPPPEVRWPALAVGADIPAGSPIRAGQALFVTQCLVCHPLNGAGAAHVGPDLNQPHSPTEYFQPWALRAFLRDPGSVRRWSAMQMPGFDAAAMSDVDLEAVLAYLAYMAARRKR
jgi:mono/diheme cytochrome c family protein